MTILKSFKRFQNFFYLIGLAPHNFSAENQKSDCYRRTPVWVSFLTSIFVTLLQFCSFYLESYGLISRLINYAFFGVTLFSNVTANWQCWYYGSTYQNIIHRVQVLENACKCKFKFSMKLSYGSIKRRYIVNVWLISGFFCVSAVVVLSQAWLIGKNPKTSVFLAFGTIFKELMCAMAILHFTLCMDIVRLLIAELNKQIRLSPIYFNTPTQVAFLKDVKLMHIDMFALMKEINQFFGWHLLVLMVHYLILITYSFYWIFLTLHNCGKFYSIAEGTLTFIYCCISVKALINSCEYCSIETTHLMENVERYGFYAFNNVELFGIKNELIQQLTNFRLDVTAKGYFTFNRRLMTSIVGSCCTYLIILIQFFLSSDLAKGSMTCTNAKH